MRILSLLTILSLMAVGASAAIINPTGAGPGGTVDPNWEVNGGDATITTGAETVPFTVVPLWAANDGSSSWIYPASLTDALDDTPGGTDWTYSTMIDLTGLQANTANIQLAIFVDDTVQDIRVGGVTIAGFGGPFGGFAVPTFIGIDGSVDSLVAGLNNLEIDVNNAYLGCVTGPCNVTGLRVGVKSATAVPEPSTYVLVGLGLAGLAFVRRRRATK